MSDALNRWTNRVINVKLQELNISQRRDQTVLRYVEYMCQINTTKTDSALPVMLSTNGKRSA